MEKLKLYFNDGTTLIMPEDTSTTYMINSVITSMTQNISVSVFHNLTNLGLLLKDLYITKIKDKIVIKAERYNGTILIDSIEGSKLTTSWNLGTNIVANEEIYNEVITIEG